MHKAYGICAKLSSVCVCVCKNMLLESWFVESKFNFKILSKTHGSSYIAKNMWPLIGLDIDMFKN